MKLRPYQEESVVRTFDYINKGGKAGLLALITAAGKSLIIAEICKRILVKKPHVRIMMLTHTKELIEQNYKRLKTVWQHAPAGIYSAGVGRKQFGYPIIYAGIQSAYRNPQLFGKVNLLLIDEAHLISDQDDSMYISFINALKEKNPDLVVIGLTATPYRLGMGYLTEGPIFNDIYYDNTKLDEFVKMIDDGYVSDLVPINMENKFDLSKVKMQGGDFQEKSLDENINRDEITRAIVLETLKHIDDRKKGLAFCVSKSHAENMALRFNEAGVPATFIHSDLNKTDREKVLEDFAAGKYKIVCNVGVLTTGFDQPDVDFLVVARPTQSTALHVQMLGRGMRIAEGKINCLVLDYAGNTLRLGPVNDPLIPQPKGQKGGEPPIRICTECQTINHAAARRCKMCGHEFPPPEIKFSSEISVADIVKRKDTPVIVVEDVQNVLVNKYVSPEGVERLKLTYITGPSGYVDQYLSFDPLMKAAYRDAMNVMGKLRFSTKPPVLSNMNDAAEFFSHYLIRPDSIKIWINKPVPNKRKKYKQILAYNYGEE